MNLAPLGGSSLKEIDSIAFHPLTPWALDWLNIINLRRKILQRNIQRRGKVCRNQIGELRICGVGSSSEIGG